MKGIDVACSLAPAWEPGISPVSLASGFIGRTFAMEDGLSPNGVPLAKREQDTPGLVLGTAHNAGATRKGLLAGKGYIAELFVLIAKGGVLQFAMQAAAFDASGEVAPIVRRHGARLVAGAWGKHAGAALEQPSADLADEGEAPRRARFDEKDGLAGSLPGTFGEAERVGAGQFRQQVSGDDEVMRGQFGIAGKSAELPAAVGQQGASGIDHRRFGFEQGDRLKGETFGGGKGGGGCAGSQIEQRAWGRGEARGSFAANGEGSGKSGGQARDQIGGGEFRSKARGASLPVSVGEDRGGVFQIAEGDACGAFFNNLLNGVG